MKYSFKTTQKIKLSEAIRSNVPGLKKGRDKSLVSAREAKVNGNRVSGDIDLNSGDIVDVFVPEAYVGVIEIKIIYSDNYIVIVDKPVHTDTQTDLPKLLAPKFGNTYPAHRLDTNTTGIVVLARTLRAHTALTSGFKSRRVTKAYVATVRGKMQTERGLLKHYLVKDEQSGTVKVFDEKVGESMDAVTAYVVLSADGDTSRLLLYPHTGRTHQLRAQLAFVGKPIIGDGKYGDFEANKKHGASMQKLRAVSIKFEGLKEPLEYLNEKTFSTEEDYE